jgi:hypothetical protein
MKMKWIYLTLLAVAIVLSGYAAIKSGLAAGDPTARPVESTAVLPTEGPAEPAPEMIHQAAVIETVNVRLEDGVQPLAALEISGWLPSACAQLDDIQIHLEGSRFVVSINSSLPQDLVCTMEAISFQMELPLNTAHLEDGAYAVEVNGVQTEFEIKTETGMQTEQPVITLQRTVCFGFCPAYTLAIYADGRVEYNGENYVEVTGAQTGSITQEQLQQLADAFNAADYFNLKDSYAAQVTDLPTQVTSFTWAGQTKTISNYGGCLDDSDDKAPQALCDLPDLIDQITNSAQWVGSGE